MLQLGIRGLGIARFKFNPISWFLKGEQGAWYDPSDLTTLFQDSAGTTPVTAVEQPVGLMLDKSRGLALGAELVTNGGPFTNTTGWVSGTTLTSTAAVSNSEIVITTTAAFGRQITTFSTVTGSTYKMTAVIRTVSGGNVYVNINRSGSQGDDLGTAQISSTINTQVQIIFTATSTTTNLAISGNANNTVCVLVSASVKQIAGNHAFQATAGNRPMLSARVNLLTKTEDFSDAVWVKSGCTYTPSILDPIGGNSATTITCTTGTCYFFYNSSSNPVIGTYSNGLWVRRRSGTGAFLVRTRAQGAPIDTAQTITTNWTYISVPCSTGGIATDNIFVLSLVTTGDSIDIWHPDLRPTNSGALLPPYQRVNTASDYDTVGFPLYLKANGTSSAMSTNSIDFSSTDKMTVVTGVRKLANGVGSSDIGTLVETSSGPNFNNGTFALIPQGTSLYSFTMSLLYKANGTATDNLTNNSAYLAPVPLVLSGKLDFAAPSNLLRANGTQAALSTVNVGSGNFGNYPLYLFARASTSGFLNGNFYGAIIRGAQSDTASVTQTENYMATKTGITF